MPICPSGLQGITADKIESDKLEALIGVAHVRTCYVTEHIGLAAASSARACATQHLELYKGFGAVAPMNGELISNLLNVCRFKTHSVKFHEPDP